MKLIEPQPAYRLYPFDRGWRVMDYVRRNIWKRTQHSTEWWFDTASRFFSAGGDNVVTKYWSICVGIGAWLGGASQYISSMVFVTTFFAIQLVLLSVWATLAIIPVFLLTAITWAYTRIYGIFYRCPDCHEAMPIPLFICPTCGVKHSRLWPSVYGITSHKCNNNGAGCETRLPTLELMGRRDLMRVCPHCEHPLNVGVGAATNLHIPIIGGRSAGKTNYIVEATGEFIHTYGEPRRIDVTFTDEGHQRMFSARSDQMARGQELEATREIVPQAYNLLIKTPARRVPHIAYIYDAAGEAYANASNTGQQGYFTYVHGIIFMIDPFALAKVRREHGAEIERVKMSLRPSTLDVTTAYANMVTTFEASVGLKPGVLFPHPIAIVISKVDALNLENEIGAPAARRLMEADPRIVLEEDAISILVRQFLLDNGLDNFVRQVELQFRNVKYFSCSALGRLPDPSNQRAFVPLRVLDPFVWLLGHAGAINALDERAKLVDAAQKTRSKTLGAVRAQRYYYVDSLRPLDPEESPRHGNAPLSTV